MRLLFAGKSLKKRLYDLLDDLRKAVVSRLDSSADEIAEITGAIENLSEDVEKLRADVARILVICERVDKSIVARSDLESVGNELQRRTDFMETIISRLIERPATTIVETPPPSNTVQNYLAKKANGGFAAVDRKAK